MASLILPIVAASASAVWTDGIKYRARLVRGGTPVEGYVTDHGGAFRYVVGDKVRRTRRFLVLGAVVGQESADDFLRRMAAQAKAEKAIEDAGL